MKPHILFLLSLTISFQILAQNAKSIDQRNGFKEFIIGDSYNKWSNQLKYVETKQDLALYYYTGTCCKELFGKKLNLIKLGFKKGKLEVINCYFEFEKYESIIPYYLKYYEGEFVSAFGKSDHEGGGELDKTGKLEEWWYTWVGEKLVLELTTYYGQSTDGYMGAQFSIFTTEESKTNRKAREFDK